MFKLLRKMFSKNKTKKENKKMADEKDVKKEVETEKVETKEPEKTEKETEKVEEKVEKKEEEKPAEEKTEKVEEEKPTEPQVQETEPEGNGIRVEDLATKDFVKEMFASFQAKYDAVVKENEDLKDKLSKMADKYEEHDFGGLQKQGMIEKDKYAETSFEEYSKHFM